MRCEIDALKIAKLSTTTFTQRKALEHTIYETSHEAFGDAEVVGESQCACVGLLNTLEITILTIQCEP